MKNLIKIVLVFTLTCTGLFSQSVFENYSKKLDLAKVLYNKKEYQNAYTKLINITNIAPDSAEANFYLGRCALELKNYDEAMAAFDRVLIINPLHVRTHLEIARIYYEVEQYSLAQIELDLVLKGELPEEVKNNVLKLKEKITNKRQKHFFGSSITLGFSYDDNANNDIGNTNFLVPAFNLYLSGNEKQSDSSAYINGSMFHKYKFDNKSWGVTNKGNIYTKTNKESEDNDISFLSFSTTPTYTQKKFQLSIPISINKVFMDSDSYSHSYNLGLRGNYILNKTSKLNTNISIKRDYNEKDSNQDSQNLLAGISYQKSFGQTPLFVVLSSNYSNNKAIDSTRTDVESKTLSQQVKLSREIVFGIRGSLSYSFIEKKYKDTDVMFRTIREDRQNNYGLGLTYIVSKTISTGFNAFFINNNSNQAPYTYDKKTYNLYFSKKF